MEIEVNPSSLIDSPYDSSSKEIFSFDENQVEDFASDIKYGPQSCYLVSGYRGVGKTSLIKVVEERIKVNEKNQNNTAQETIFIYAGFAGFSKSNHLVRKLVRELYLTIDQSTKFQELKEKQDDPENLKDSLRLLHQRTFNEIVETNEKSTTREKQLLFEMPFKELFRELIKQVSPLLVLLLWSTPLFSQLKTSWLIEWGIPVASILWAIVNVVTIKFSFLKKSAQYKSLLTKSLYDEEIAETLFLGILKKAKQKGFRIVFVLDELDKVNHEQIEALIGELKVYLVSGYATFIVVGGQDFYYKFNEENEIDDSILSSLFSKVYHVPISTSVLLKNFFYKHVAKNGELDKLSDSDRNGIGELIDFYIFQSRLIQRRFVTRLRQNLVWRDGKAYLTSGKSPRNLSIYKLIIEAIDQIDDSKISSEHPGAIRDFIIMQMYIDSVRIAGGNTNKNSKTNPNV